MLLTSSARRLLAALVFGGAFASAVASGQPSTSKPLTAAECRRLFAEANRDVANTRARIRNSCAKNDECGLRTAWGPDGGGSLQTFSVPKRSEADFAEADRKFREWREGGCMAVAPVPIPTQKPYWASCTNGKCTAVEGAPPP